MLDLLLGREDPGTRSCEDARGRTRRSLVPSPTREARRMGGGDGMNTGYLDPEPTTGRISGGSRGGDGLEGEVGEGIPGYRAGERGVGRTIPAGRGGPRGITWDCGRGIG